MRLRSTRGNPGEVSFAQAVLAGPAADGGLYEIVDRFALLPLFEQLPQPVDFLEVATRVMTVLLADEMSPSAVAEVCRRAFTFSPHIRALDRRLRLLELFHGPSLAFKDFGAGFLARFMEHLSAEPVAGAEPVAPPRVGGDTRRVVLTATSGDTGSAVAQAFYRCHGIDVVILYPSGRVSRLQEQQLTSLGANIHALEVAGSFDDCQAMVKSVFSDRRLSRRLGLTSANSINIGRLLPQSLYYVWAWANGNRDEAQYFCVPSGNFGNLTAGVLAWTWGLPVAGFIAATNANDVVPQYLQTGRFEPRPSVATVANAMDVGNPSNFERLAAIFPNRDAMAALVVGDAVTDDDILRTIARYHRERGLFVDPHTAAGLAAAERRTADQGAGVVTVLATAHAAKFAEVVRRAGAGEVPLPPALAAVQDLPKQATPVGNRVGDLVDFLTRNFRR